MKMEEALDDSSVHRRRFFLYRVYHRRPDFSAAAFFFCVATLEVRKTRVLRTQLLILL